MGPPAQGQPEVLAALRNAVASRPGGGITPDATGANFFAMPAPNSDYGTSFNQLLTAMVNRGPQVTPDKAAAAAGTGQPDPAQTALAAIRAAGNKVLGPNQAGAGMIRDQGMSDIAWRRATDAALADADLSGMTEEQRAAFDEQYKGLKPPKAPAFISDRGGVR